MISFRLYIVFHKIQGSNKFRLTSLIESAGTGMSSDSTCFEACSFLATNASQKLQISQQQCEIGKSGAFFRLYILDFKRFQKAHTQTPHILPYPPNIHITLFILKIIFKSNNTHKTHHTNLKHFTPSPKHTNKPFSY